MTVNREFLGRVGHDLRNELNTIVTSAHYLRRYESDLGVTSRQMLERVGAAGERMKRLLNEFDDAVWIREATSAALEREPCELDVLVKEALGRLKEVIETLEVTVDLKLPPGLPGFYGDKRLSSASIEYVIDFALTRSKQKEVHITAAVSEGRAVLSVADEGGALSDEAKEKLFEPFFEREVLPPHEAGKRKRNRLGLGLAITRGVLAAHGGAITADASPDGKGLVLSCAFSPAEAK